MTESNDWNANVISEFRQNGGRVGGPFEGAPITLIHHRGRNSGKEYVSPVMYQPAGGDADGDTIYVFASKAGAPENPGWYHNLTGSGSGTVEVGTDSYPVTVTELTGDERDKVWDEQVRRYPGFGEYAAKTAGIRTIPVLALRRA